MIGPKYIHHVLINNGASINIFFASFLAQLGYGDDYIDACKKITTKAYDEEECKSKGIVVLLVWVGPISRDVIYQVLDILLAFNS